MLDKSSSFFEGCEPIVNLGHKLDHIKCIKTSLYAQKKYFWALNVSLNQYLNLAIIMLCVTENEAYSAFGTFDIFHR